MKPIGIKSTRSIVFLAFAAILFVALGGGLRANPSAGDIHSSAVIPPGGSGSLWTWGSNDSGQLGFNNRVGKIFPSRIGGDSDWDAVGAGVSHTVAIKAGQLYAWGGNSAGQLGYPSQGRDVLVPTIIPDAPGSGFTNAGFVDVAVGSYHTLALHSDGSLWAWGSNATGQVGTGTLTTQLTPIQITPAETYTAISAGGRHSLAIRAAVGASQGQLFTWGSNDQGQLGVGEIDENENRITNLNVPTQVGSDSDWTLVSAGGLHSLAVRGGQVYAWGRGKEFQLGRGTINDTVYLPNLVPDQTEPTFANSNVTAIGAGDRHSLVVTGAGLYGWGLNSLGQLGVGTTDNIRLPREISIDGAGSIVAISAGRRHTLVADDGGRVFATGSNLDFQLGDSAVTNFTSSFIELRFEENAGGFINPDFTISGVSVTTLSNQFARLQEVGYQFSLNNIGADFIPEGTPLTIQVYLEDVDGNLPDVLVDTVTFSSVLNNEESVVLPAEGSRFFTMPESIAAGIYRLRFVADPGTELDEENDDNNVAFSSREYEVFEAPDFSITAGVVDADVVRPGEEVDFVFSLNNSADAGTYPFDAGLITFRITMTSDTVLGNADDIQVGTGTIDINSEVFGVNDGLTPGESIQVRVPDPNDSDAAQPVFPTDIDTGDYIFVFEIDSAEGIPETDETNNQFPADLGTATPIAFLPDPAVVDTEDDTVEVSSTELIPGEDLEIEYAITNAGASYGANTESLITEVFLSLDESFDAGDIVVSSVAFEGAFPTNEVITSDLVVALPESIPAGSYFVGVRTNADSSVDEVDVTNNAVFSDGRFNIFADFVVTEALLPDTSFIPGSTVGFKVTGQNLRGAHIAGPDPISIGVSLSRDTVFGNGDDIPFVGSIDFSGDLDSGESFTDSQPFAVPANVPAGTYRVLSKIDPDNLIEEQNNGNNTLVSTETFTLLGDLVVESVNFTAGTYSRGQSIPVDSITVRNSSLYDLPASTTATIRVLLSTDRVVGGLNDAILVDSVSFTSAIPAGSTIDVPLAGEPDLSAVVPTTTPIGEYFIGAVVDTGSQVTEQNETNNTAFSDFRDISISGVNLGEAIEDHLADVDQLNATPLVGGSGAWFGQTDVVDSGTAAGQAGTTGNGESSFFEIPLTVSETSEISFRWKVSSEAGFDFLRFTIDGEETADIPGISGDIDWIDASTEVEAGTYLLRWSYIKDSTTAKLDDTAYVDTLAVTPVGPPADDPDFEIQDVFIDATNGQLSPVASVEFSVTVVNNGGDYIRGALPATVALRLSLDQTTGPTDILLADVDIDRNIDGESTAVLTGSFLVPPGTPADLYFISATVDDDDNVVESDETNNTVFTADNFDVLAVPDFTLQNAVPAAFDPRPEEIIDFAITIGNGGDSFLAGSGPLTTEVRLTRDAVYGNADDVVVGTFELNTSLLAGTTVETEQQITIPGSVPAGSYRFAFRVDSPDDFDELDETANNTLIGTEVYDFFVDLSVVSADIFIANDPIPGETVQASVTYENIGSDLVNGAGPVEVRYVFTSNAVLGDADDIEILTEDSVAVLGFEEEGFESASLTIPVDIPAGTYSVGIIINPDATIAELSAAENAIIVDEPFGVFPDFVLDSIQVPETGITPGGSIGLKLNGRNRGATHDVEPGADPVAITAFLVSETDADSPSRIDLTGVIDISGDIPATGTFSGSVGYGIPATVNAGTYFVGAVVDSADAYSESNEFNNAIFSATSFDLFSDLRISSLSYDAGTYSRGQSVTGVTVSVTNDGLFALPAGTAFTLDIFLSSDRIAGNINDSALLSSYPIVLEETLDGGDTVSIPLGGGDPFDPAVGGNAPDGSFFIGATVDADGAITEEDEDNNLIFSAQNNVVVGAVSLAEALEDHLDPVDQTGYLPTVGGDAAWFGQSAIVEPGGGASAAQSGRIGDGQSSFFEVQVSNLADTEVSFFWKVSSEEGFDFLSFSVDGTQRAEISPISGDVDWVQVSTELSAGTHILRWTYSKDADTTQGQDAGFVDRLEVNPLGPPVGNPDFRIGSITLFDEDGTDLATNGQVLSPVGPISFEVTIENLGSTYLAGANPIAVQLVLSSDELVDGGDYVLGTFDLTGNVPAEASVTLQGSFDVEGAPIGIFFVGAVVDSNLAVVENDESNNQDFTPLTYEVVDLPDLTMATVTIAEGDIDARPEGEVTLNATLRNDGDDLLAAGGPIEVDVFLTRDGTVGNADDIPVGSYQRNAGIDAGQLAPQTVTLTLPDDIDSGVYRFGFAIDPADSIPESDATNNTFVTTSTFTFLPDLVANAFLTPDPAATELLPGDSFDLTVLYSNEAANIANPDQVIRFRVVLSADATVDAGDAEVGILQVIRSLDRVGEVSLSGNLTLPASILPGEYRLLVEVNPDGLISELDDTNNTAVGESLGSEQVYPIFPDFDIESFLVPNVSFEPGSTAGFKLTGRNRGAFHFAGAEPISVAFFLSRDGILDADDVELTGSLTFSGDLDSGATFVDSQPFVVPAPLDAGAYRVIALIDSEDAYSELDEFNNTRVSDTTLELFPDLSVSTIAYTPGNVTQGGAFDLTSFTLANNEAFTIPSGTVVPVRIVLSTDRLVGDINDVTVVAFELTLDAPLAGNDSLLVDLASEGISPTIPASAPVDSYFTGVVVDPANALAEANEDNNTTFSSFADVVVTGATLAEALEDHAPANPVGFNPVLAGDAPWFGQTVETDGSPAAGQSGPLLSGQTSSFSMQIVPSVTSEITFDWKVSSEAGFDFLAFTIDGEPVIGIDPISGDVDWTARRAVVSPGSHLLEFTYTKDSTVERGTDAAFVDNLEVNPLVVVGDPDFEATDVIITPDLTELSPIETVDFEITLFNDGSDYLGDGADPVEVELVLSADQLRDAGDIVLATGESTGTFTTSSSTFVSGEFTIPPGTPPGTYFLLANVDPNDAIAEDDEANNVFVRPGTVDVLSFPDLRVLSGAITTPAPVPGGEVTLDFTLGNTGDDLRAAAGGFDVEFRLTPNGVVGDADDIVVDTFRISSSILSNQPLVSQQVFTIPTNIVQGDYRVALIVDSGGEITEEIESNNTFIAPLADAVEFRPDFAFGSFTSVEPLEVLPGEALDLGFVIENLGSGFPAGAGTIDVRIFLSTNEVAGDADDAVLEDLALDSTGIPALGSISLTAEPTIPTSILPGIYRVGVEVNYNGTLDEIDPANNAGFSTTTYNIFPDFVVSSLLRPEADFAPNSVIGFKVTTLNQGAIHVAGAEPLALNIALTQNAIFGDADDIPLAGEIATTQNLASGATFTESRPFTLPADVPAGTYRIAAKADSGNAYAELDETNNTFLSDPIDLLLDLRVVSFTYTGQAYDRGESIDLSSVTIENLSPYTLPAGEEVTLQFFLSQDRLRGDINDFDLVADFPITLDSDLTGGDTLIIDLTAQAGFDAVIGDSTRGAQNYYVGARVDSAEVIRESNETNNTAFSSFPDVTVSGVTLASALEDHAPLNPIGYTAILGGEAAWFAQSTEVDGGAGVNAGQSGDIDDGETTFFEVQVNLLVNSSLSFLWKVSSEAGFDFLSFTLDGEPVPEIDPISGDVDWTQVSTLIPAGTHVLRWTYSKDSDTSQLLDAGFVDSVEINPLSVGGDPDLIINNAFIGADNNELSPVQAVDYEVTLQNVGADFAAGADPVRVELRLSSDQTFDAGDTFFGEALLTSSLLSGSTAVVSGSATVNPATPVGNYFIVVEVDNPDRVTESDETNNTFATTETFEVLSFPDLVVLGATIEDITLRPGEFATFEVTLANQEDDLPADAGTLTSAIIMTTNATIGDADDVAVGTFEVNSGIDGETSINVTQTFQLPTAIPFGSYRFAVVVDSTGDIAEDSESNNTFVTPSASPFVFNPDFEITQAVTESGEKLPGDSVAFSGNITNTGASYPAGAVLPINIVLTTNGTVGDADDVVLTTTNSTAGVAFGGELLVDASATIPESITPGAYQLAINVNPGGGLAEIETGDNFRIATDDSGNAVVYRIFRDFVLDEFLVPETGFVPGGDVGFKVTVRNRGADHDVAPSDSFDVSVYLSTDKILDAGDTQLAGAITFTGDLLSGGSLTTSDVFTQPDPTIAGTYFFIAEVDSGNAFPEANEFNNTLVSTASVDFLSDLQVINLAYTPGTFDRGDTISIASIDLLNNTDYTIPAGTSVTATFVLSLDRVVGNGDDSVLIETITLSDGLAGGASTTVNLPGGTAVVGDTIPQGSYFLGVRVDPLDAIAEDDETNNDLFSNFANIEIDVPTVAEALEDHLAANNQISPTVLNSGDSAWFGQETEVSPSGGSSAAQSGVITDGGVSEFGFQLEIVDESDVSFFWKVDSEAGFDFLRFTIDGDEVSAIPAISGDVDWARQTVRLEPGIYVLRWAYEKDDNTSKGLDAAWVDQFEVNTVPPVGGNPDFRVFNFVIGPTDGGRLSPLEPTPFQVTVENLGGNYVPGVNDDPVEIELRISSDLTDDAGDTVVATETFASAVNTGDTVLISGEIEIPGGTLPGQYFVTLKVDAAETVLEQNENNNLVFFTSGTPAVEQTFDVLSFPDLQVTSLTIRDNVGDPDDDFDPRPGGSVTLDITLSNIGDDLPNGVVPIPVQIRLTEDGLFGGADDVIIGEFDLVTGLTGGSSLTSTQTFTLPTDIDRGDYAFAARVDYLGSIAELDEDNNTFPTAVPGAGAFVAFEPDFAVNSATVTSTDLLPGQPVVFDLDVINLGANFLDDLDDVTIDVFLRPTPGPGADIPLGSLRGSGGLDFGSSYVFTGESADMPDSIDAGEYFVGFTVNAPASVTEPILTNNELLVGDPDGQPFPIDPDFFISEFLVPSDDFTPGNTAGFKVTVQNQGANFIFDAQAVEVKIFLLPIDDERNVIGDAIAFGGQIDFAQDFASGSFAGESASFSAPSDIPAGTYTVAARVDPDGLLSEQLETNNQRVALNTYNLLADLQVSVFTFTNGTYVRASSVGTSEIPVTELTLINESNFIIPAGTVIAGQVRLSKDRIWGNVDDVILVEDASLPAPANFIDGGASLTIPVANAIVPDSTPAGDYFLAVRMDREDIILETDDTNNTAFSTFASITIDEPTIGEAIEDHLPAPVGATPSFEEQRGYQPVVGGVSPWYAQTGTISDDGSVAAAQAGAIGDDEETYFEVTTFETERFQLEFDWAVDSEESFDFLILSINGEEYARISGDVDYTPFNIGLQAGSYTFRWTYRKDSSESRGADTAFVDNVTIKAPTTQSNEPPDFVVASANFAAGTYIVQRDRFPLNAIGTNLGGDLDPTNLSLSVEGILSTDREFGNSDDILLGTFPIAELLNNGNQFVYTADPVIASSNRAGQTIPASASYYVGLRIDPPINGDFDGNFTESNETNNIFWSDDPSVVVETRADLSFENFDYTPGLYQYGDTIQMSFDLVNSGLRNIPAVLQGGPAVEFQVRIGGVDGPLSTFTFGEGLAIGERRFFQLSVEVPDGFPVTDTCDVINVVADTSNLVDESNETLNGTGNTVIDTSIIGIDLGDAIDLPELRWVLGGDVCAGTFSGVSSPSLDGIDSVSAPTTLSDGAQSTLSTTLFVEEDTTLQFTVLGRTFLRLYQDETLIDEEIVQGVTDSAWRTYTFNFEAGHFYTIEFVQGTVTIQLGVTDNGEPVEPGNSLEFTDEANIDRGQLFRPQLVVDDFDFSGAVQPLDRGDEVDLSTFSFRIRNDGGIDVPPNTPIAFQFVLSQDRTFGNSDDYLIRSNALGFVSDVHSVKLDIALVAGDPGPAVQIAEDFSLIVPESVPPGSYLLGVFLNPNGDIVESSSADNIAFSTNQVVQVRSVGNGGNAITTTTGGDLASGTFTRTSNLPFFGFLDDPADPDDTFDGIDAIRTPDLNEGEETSLQLNVTGPVEVTFQWRSELLPVLNSLGFYLDDVLQARIEGETDWTEVSVLVGSGDHTLRWTYMKGKANSGEAAYIDQVSVNTYDLQPTTLAYTDATYDRGEAFDLDITVVNNGSSVVEASKNLTGQVFLTTDESLGDTDDVLLGTFDLDEDIAGGGGSEVFAFSANIPAETNPDDYFVAVIVDHQNELNETDEGNNRSLSLVNPITVDGATVITVDEGLDYTLNFAAPPAAPLTFTGTSAWYGTETLPGPAGTPPTDDGDVAQAPLLANVGDTATFGTNIEGPYTVAFEWRLSSSSDVLAFTVDDVVEAQLVGDGDDTWQAVEVIIPSGEVARRLRWTYTRGGEDADAFGLINNLRITEIDQPDLRIASIDFTAGDYVLQRDTLDLTIVGFNAGVDLEPRAGDVPSEVFEVEVRLSLDDIFGDEDDIVLGKLNEIERIDSKGRFVYAQVFDLDLPFEEGTYRVAAFVDSTNLYDEFDEDNNIVFSDADAGETVTIERRPNLVIRNINYRSGEYFRRGELELDFDIANIGYADFPTGESFTVTVEFKGSTFDQEENEDGIVIVTETAIENLDRVLVAFNDSQGIQADLDPLVEPTAQFRTSIQIPRFQEDDVVETFGSNGNLEVQDESEPIGPNGFNRVEFALDFTLTASIGLVTDELELLGTHDIEVIATPADQSFADFQAFWDRNSAGVTGAKGDNDDADSYGNLLEFAMGMDPQTADPLGAPVIGFIEVNDQQFMSISLNVLAASVNSVAGENLDYVIQVDDNPGFNSPTNVVTINAGDSLNTIRAKAGVVSATDNGYTYRVTVRDSTAVNDLASRYMRLVITDN